MPAPKAKQTFYTIRIGENFHDVTGRKRTPKGYVVLCIKSHPHSDRVNGYIFEHRVVAEMQLGRYLTPGEVVHHVNEIKHDNRIGNLEVMSHVEHTLKHHLGAKRSERTKQKISDQAKERLNDKTKHPSYKHINKSELFVLVEKVGPTEAAKQLGVSRKTIYNKLKEFREDEAI
ncbi:HNH endonuclease [Lysinibacillus xylanilyticus]|uniref:HNH endonuclease n=1 Tax=Lysinibacillus xylanilyticus TaxID=582475 RepID=UPI00381000C0